MGLRGESSRLEEIRPMYVGHLPGNVPLAASERQSDPGSAPLLPCAPMEERRGEAAHVWEPRSSCSPHLPPCPPPFPLSPPPPPHHIRNVTGLKLLTCSQSIEFPLLIKLQPPQ